VSGERLGEGHAVLSAEGLTPETYTGAVERLAGADPVLGGVVDRCGPPPFWRHPEGFGGLVQGILVQQVSLESAVALDLDRLAVAADDEVRGALIAVRGIGRWTADVYLLFALRRPDAWPSGDLALAKAVGELWGLPTLPDWDELDAWAERWRPQRAVAARFLWHDYLSRRGRGWAG
jgi:DNA-3-methyladenine glycosylase II